MVGPGAPDCVAVGYRGVDHCTDDEDHNEAGKLREWRQGDGKDEDEIEEQLERADAWLSRACRIWGRDGLLHSRRPYRQMKDVLRLLEAERETERQYVVEAADESDYPAGWPAALLTAHIAPWRGQLPAPLSQPSPGAPVS